LARESIVTWESGAHGNTYGGNPVASAAALKTIELVQNEYMHNAEMVGEYTMQALSEMQERHACIGQVRGKGLMIGVEFVSNRETKQTDSSIVIGLSIMP